MYGVYGNFVFLRSLKGFPDIVRPLNSYGGKPASNPLVYPWFVSPIEFVEVWSSLWLLVDLVELHSEIHKKKTLASYYVPMDETASRSAKQFNYTNIEW